MSPFMISHRTLFMVPFMVSYGETCSLPKREMALECSRKSHEASENASSSDSNHST